MAKKPTTPETDALDALDDELDAIVDAVQASEGTTGSRKSPEPPEPTIAIPEAPTPPAGAFTTDFVPTDSDLERLAKAKGTSIPGVQKDSEPGPRPEPMPPSKILSRQTQLEMKRGAEVLKGKR